MPTPLSPDDAMETFDPSRIDSPDVDVGRWAGRRPVKKAAEARRTNRGQVA